MEQDGRRPTDPSRGRRVPGENVKQAHYRWPLDRTRDRGHGRVELRTRKAVSVSGLGFPDAAQVTQVTRKARDLGTCRWQTVTVYAITSLPFELASPARLADLLRGHWSMRRCTTSAISPSPRTAPRSAPAPAQA